MNAAGPETELSQFPKQKRRFVAKKVIAAMLLSVAIMLAGIHSLAKHDVLFWLRSEPMATITVKDMGPSKTYIFYITFEIHGHTQLNYAYWRLLPFRQIDVSK
jgi:hypothetical protein